MNYESDFGNEKPIIKYVTPPNRPTQHGYTKYFVYSQGMTLFVGIRDEFETWKASEGAAFFKRDAGPVIERVIDEVALLDAKLAWSAEVQRRQAEFKIQLAAYYDVIDHPKFDLAFAMAVENSQNHSLDSIEDLDDVAYQFQKLVRLL